MSELDIIALVFNGCLFIDTFWKVLAACTKISFGIKKENIMTFKKTFKDIYSEALIKKGYQYNSKYGMFVKFVNGELLQYITYHGTSSIKRGYKAYRVMCGILSVYTHSYLRQQLLYWVSDLFYFSCSHGMQQDESCRQYHYNEENMQTVIEESLKKTMEVIVPIFDGVQDLESYIEFQKKTRIDALRGASNLRLCINDALVLIKADNHDDFTNIIQKELDRCKKMIEQKQMGGTYEEQENLLYRAINVAIVESRDKIYENPELYAEALKEIERRKQKNLQILREYKVI